jgi:hypothetical protein
MLTHVADLAEPIDAGQLGRPLAYRPGDLQVCVGMNGANHGPDVACEVDNAVVARMLGANHQHPSGLLPADVGRGCRIYVRKEASDIFRGQEPAENVDVAQLAGHYDIGKR